MLRKKSLRKSKQSSSTLNKNNVEHSSSQHQLGCQLNENLEKLNEDLGNSSDLITRVFHLAKDETITMAIVYMDGLVNQDAIHNFILETLMLNVRESELNKIVLIDDEIYSIIKESLLTIGEVNEIMDYDSLYNHLLSGDTIILIDGLNKGFSAGTRGGESRGVTETSTQNVIRGPKDAFSENLRTNTSLIRRRVKDPNLWMETRQIGKRTKTNVAIMYLKGIANDKVVKEVLQRIDRIEIDGILEGGYIEELIQDKTFTPFPTVYNSERPDTICAGLLEGRIAIVVDGTPFVLLVPALFVHFFQASEDYYQRYDISTLIRILRYTAFLMSLLVPSMFIAVTTFHQEMLPTPLLISLASQREAVPFPAFIEALIMEAIFEILREAGVRMPKAIGSAISIVGALVLGQAAVQAGLISPAMVIVVSLTAISSFVTPSFNMAISVRMIRFLFMGLAASFGMFGIILGLIVLVLHLCSLRSFGIPYMAPMGPYIKEDQKDAILRLPHWFLSKRPRLINQTDYQREDTPQPQPQKS